MAAKQAAVPVRDQGLTARETVISESQEPMMAAAAPADLDAFLAICARWDVPATVIGEVKETGRLEVTWRGELVVDIPPASAAEGPLYERPAARPAGLGTLRDDHPAGLRRPATRAGLRADPRA